MIEQKKMKMGESANQHITDSQSRCSFDYYHHLTDDTVEAHIT